MVLWLVVFINLMLSLHVVIIHTLSCAIRTYIFQGGKGEGSGKQH